MAILKPPSRQKRDLPRQQLTRIFRLVEHGSLYVCCLATSFPWDKKGALMGEESLSASDARKNVGSSIQGLGKAYDHFLMT
jgi:hypothetical protein